MLLTFAWIAPLTWGMAALITVLALNSPRTPRPDTPEPTHTAKPNRLPNAA
jgi:hypothetical protein